MSRDIVILASIRDAYFASQLEGAAGGLGHRVEYLGEGEDLREKLRQVGPALIVVNLGDEVTDWSGIIGEAKGLAKDVPVLAFGLHTDLASRERALAAGADVVTSNALFSTQLPRLIQKYTR